MGRANRAPDGAAQRRVPPARTRWASSSPAWATTGAAGLLEMRQAGAQTLGQDEESCVVYGMPKEAVKKGAVQKSVPLSAIAREIVLQHAVMA